MPSYIWKGRTRAGQIQSGVEVAESKEAVIATLRGRQIIPTTVKEKGKEVAVPTVGGRVREKEIAIFTRQFSVMIDAGLPLVQCLEILGNQQDNKTFSKVILNVRQDVESGQSLSEALRKHPKIFDDLFVNMVAAGEAGGILDIILQRLSTYIEKNAKLKAQVKSAMIYPIAVISIAAIVVTVILWKVIPTFAELFSSLGAELPLPTRIVIFLSKAMGTFGPFIVVAIILCVVAIRKYHDTYKGRRVLDNLLLKVPVLGEILRKIAIARFCRTLSTLTVSGVPILDGLEITARTSGNAIIEDAIMETRKSISEGKTIAEPLKGTRVFPPMVTQMISVGEQTGALDNMLAKIADFYEDEVDRAIEGLISLLEPVMIAFLGTIIGGIVVAMYLPLFTLINKI
jgi:type IV pilus assembly protein PilC